MAEEQMTVRDRLARLGSDSDRAEASFRRGATATTAKARRDRFVVCVESLARELGALLVVNNAERERGKG